MPTPPDPRRHDLSHRDTQIRRAIRDALVRDRRTQNWLAAEVGRSRQFVSVKLSGMARLRQGDVERFLTAMESELVETPRGPIVVKCQTVVV
jgi:hypothetical protein